ncbi:thioredoxin domain-containing protein [Candidatus Bathyarchaeota archaeon A05DMB-2]|jgi:uncharacterized protein YyaL (SSP411 family)|nr:thioredoxin domain-containing protein [Candidatus Bathyarchaeota archaeon A05DMB-2]
MKDETLRQHKPNRLINEKSPYLLQHVYNPVDWYPWSDEAFAKAKAEDKPVFVSIGYSSCHWCHVMEKECFDDQEVAKLMNEAFVSIKVDREERPDLDSAYMRVCQAMGRSCGWPLNVILTPDKKPFFAASYIPKNSRFGSAGMMDLIPQIAELWKTRRTELETLGRDITHRLTVLEERAAEEELGKDVLDDAYEKLVLNFDEENGGFGSAPKFPTPHILLFLLRYWHRTKEKTALAMAEKTLRAMRLGDIFDQIGYGFHRYSTDAEWLVPHFEKMLYDQALLALAYTEAYQATGAGKFKVTAQEVLEYTLRDLASPEGGFYSAEDADSEGEEGKFYLWTEEEIREVLPAEDASLAVKLFGIKSGGNFVEPGGTRSGKNILHWAKSLDEAAKEAQLNVDKFIFRLSRICNALFEARKKRIHPAKDDKILADWNGLMIAALARASQAFGEQKYLQSAVRAADFALENMRNSQHVLLHRYVKGESAVEGFLDDYAFLAWGLIEVYEANFDERHLNASVELTEAMIARFWDERKGGFYFTAKGVGDVALPLIKEAYDGASPSGNSVALLNLLRLAMLTGNSRFEDIANRLAKTFAREVKRTPEAHTFMLVGLDFALGPAYNVILVGEPREKDMLEMLDALRKQYMPNLVVSLRKPEATGLGYEMVEGKATAYVCRGQTCMPATNSVAKMLKFLGVKSA